MQLSLPLRPFGVLVAILASLSSLASAERVIESDSLSTCQVNSSFTATLFNVIFTPDNNSLAFDVVGVSSISGFVTAEIQFFAYGYLAVKQSIDPCDQKLTGMCPMNTGPIQLPLSNIPVSPDAVKKLPGIAYTWPDLDGVVKIYVKDKATQKSVACVQASLSNRKTVYQKGVGWATAIIAGLALVSSAVTSGLGHSNTAAHVAANALSLFGFFQAQAIIGMTSVPLPPMVKAWTQNFQWSMGIIRIGFLQDICTWYQRATGGKPSTLLSTLSTASVQVQKRSEGFVHNLFLKAHDELVKRQSAAPAATAPGSTSTTTSVVVRGIKRVGFKANIESTNIFLTGLIFFMVFIALTAIIVALFKGFCEAAVKAKWLKGHKFEDFRDGWRLVLKGILFRLVLIGYPQMCILCLWELTQRDSVAEVILGLFFFISMTVALLWAALKVYRIARRSVSMHKNPAYILYSDPSALNKWGFLYVQFRATAYYFILPLLLYILIKSLFIAFAQPNGTIQAIALVIIEAVFLISVSILRPWMDKKTNAFNISIAAMNFLNVIFLLVFTAVFNQPGIVTGVMGVIFFFMNAIFATVLVIMVLFATVYAIISKNPDTRYQPMRDDRGSFIKSSTQLNTELDALGATARGDMTQTAYKTRDLDDDEDSYSSNSGRHPHDPSGGPLPHSTANSNRSPVRHNDGGPRSPMDSTAFLPSDGPPRHGSPNYYSDSPKGSSYGGYTDNNSWAGGNNGGGHAPPKQIGYRQQNSGSPWQRGAGYDH